ncbi:81_t:CDS:2 [Ambispora gerdemannii]|uniref:81_t:CDS:1 n=1 Tax=Ambispora gerdemannii TaxID=144530 RepID=A0A9N9CRF8_9GLOM|nr:81_t:CDS:2 [Ambispora gerdemannii]
MAKDTSNGVSISDFYGSSTCFSTTPPSSPPSPVKLLTVLPFALPSPVKLPIIPPSPTSPHLPPVKIPTTLPSALPPLTPLPPVKLPTISISPPLSP